MTGIIVDKEYHRVKGGKLDIRKEHFPISITDMLKIHPRFSYFMCDLCPLQRLMVFGGPKDSRLAGMYSTVVIISYQVVVVYNSAVQ